MHWKKMRILIFSNLILHHLFSTLYMIFNEYFAIEFENDILILENGLLII